MVWIYADQMLLLFIMTVGCWHGYLCGARCWPAYGPADATATHCLLLQLNPDWFTFLVPAHLGIPGKRAVKRVCVWERHHILGTTYRRKIYHSCTVKTWLSIIVEKTPVHAWSACTLPCHVSYLKSSNRLQLCFGRASGTFRSRWCEFG